MASRPIQILLIAAHPADSFDAAGGTLAHHVARGDRVSVAIATTGVRSHHWELLEQKRLGGADFDVEARLQQAVEEKLAEVRNACRILGFEDVRDLGFDDDDILVTQDKIEAIADVIREVKPDVLITHHPYESGGFKMHGTIGQCTLYAWQIASGVGRGRQVRHHVPIIYFMNPQAYIGNNSLEYAGTGRADLYIDITDVITQKVQALDSIASQYYAGPYSRKRAESEDGHLGNHASVAYAEQFQRFLPMVRYTLPITDADLEHGSEAPEAMMGRRAEMVGGLAPLPPGASFTSHYRVPQEKYKE